MNDTCYKKSQRGYIAFTSILIISAVTLTVATSIVILGVQELKSALDYKKGHEVLVITESCVEEALQRLRDNSSYSGGSLNVGNGSCTINISNASPNFTIMARGDLSGPPAYSKKIKVTVRRTDGSINVIDWQETK